MVALFEGVLLILEAMYPIKTKRGFPWKVGTHDPRVVFDAHGNEVATVHGHYDDAVPKARFIAAAPDLLAALESFVWLHDSTDRRLCEDAGVSPNTNGCDCDLCLRSKAAIAAASEGTKWR